MLQLRERPLNLYDCFDRCVQRDTAHWGGYNPPLDTFPPTYDNEPTGQFLPLCGDVDDLHARNPLRACRDRSNFSKAMQRAMVPMRAAAVWHGDAQLRLRVLRGYGVPKLFSHGTE